MKSGFDYKEYVKWVENIGMLERDFQIWLKQFLLVQAKKVVELGKPRTPVDTSELINSWSIGSQKIVQKERLDAKGNVMYSSRSGRSLKEIDWSKSDIANIDVIGDYLQVEIGLTAQHASYIEYGHHSYQGRYMLTISIDEVRRQLPIEFDAAWRKLLADKGVI